MLETSYLWTMTLVCKKALPYYNIINYPNSLIKKCYENHGCSVWRLISTTSKMSISIHKNSKVLTAPRRASFRACKWAARRKTALFYQARKESDRMRIILPTIKRHSLWVKAQCQSWSKWNQILINFFKRSLKREHTSSDVHETINPKKPPNAFLI